MAVTTYKYWQQVNITGHSSNKRQLHSRLRPTVEYAVMYHSLSTSGPDRYINFSRYTTPLALCIIFCPSVRLVCAWACTVSMLLSRCLVFSCHIQFAMPSRDNGSRSQKWRHGFVKIWNAPEMINGWQMITRFSDLVELCGNSSLHE